MRCLTVVESSTIAKSDARGERVRRWHLSAIVGFASFAALFASVASATRCVADETPAMLDRQYQSAILPLIERYCFDCHAEEVTEADLDFASFKSLDDVRRETKVWIRVREMLDTNQMPPEDAEQPAEDEATMLRDWVRAFLKHEATAYAGDPGSVALRRLTNAEYNYSLRDITGVDALDPTREFPVDGAAGEGFTNVGFAQGMSPALATKYLDAAKRVATHAVLLPETIRFSPYNTRRDHTDEWLARIQAFYDRFTDEGGGAAVNLQGIKFRTNVGGLLPLRSI